MDQKWKRWPAWLSIVLLLASGIYGFELGYWHGRTVERHLQTEYEMNGYHHRWR